VGNRRYDENTFRAALADPTVRTMADLCRAVGIVPRGANYETLRQYADGLGLELAPLLAQRQLGLDEVQIARFRRERFRVDDVLRVLELPRTTRHRQAVRLVLDLDPIDDGPRDLETRTTRSYSDAQLREAIDRSSSFGDLCELLGLSCVSGTRARLRRRAAEIGMPLPAAWSRPGRGPDGSRRRPTANGRRPPKPVSARPTPTEDELRALVSTSGCLADALRTLGLKPTSGNDAWLRRTLATASIDATDLRRGTRTRAEPLDDVLVAGRLRSSPWLRQRLIDEGRREPRCARCRGTTWQGTAIPLELDHIDGDRRNNRDENLRLLCPNCHALTPTYRGRDIGRQALRDASA
jgi:5-methylcytosine-specific restriction endonuclease McrA